MGDMHKHLKLGRPGGRSGEEADGREQGRGEERGGGDVKQRERTKVYLKNTAHLY